MELKDPGHLLTFFVLLIFFEVKKPQIWCIIHGINQYLILCCLSP